jgi:hypothetical protein
MMSVLVPQLLLVCGAFAVLANAAAADESYTIYRTGVPLTIDGRLDEAAWTAAPDVGGFVFPWWQAGRREQTVAKLLWDDEHLYAAFLCEDAHIWAEHTQRDSTVYRDDCVEVFTAPNPDRPDAYFNIEMNVLGIVLDQWHPKGPGKPVPGQWNGEDFRIATSVVGTLNDEGDEDQYWVLEAAIPLANFALSGAQIPPQAGDIWHLNLNRCGGRTNEQYSQWQASQTAKPSFHQPGDFGQVEFSRAVSPFWRE